MRALTVSVRGLKKTTVNITGNRASEGSFAGFFIALRNGFHMASFHHRIKSGRKGSAEEHAAYVVRQGKHAARGDLLATGMGNMPVWARECPALFWRLADRHERSNGAAYRELEVALPNEMVLYQQIEVVERLVDELVGPRPHQWAIHGPESSLEGVANVHAHIVYSDRVDDGISRPPEQTFRRYNPTSPRKGGCRKESGGRTPSEVREEMKVMRQQCADIQNEVLAKYGHEDRVDPRTLAEQGIDKVPERHLGRARIRRMSREEKAGYVAERRARSEFR